MSVIFWDKIIRILLYFFFPKESKVTGRRNVVISPAVGELEFIK